MSQLPDEVHDVIADCALPLPPSLRESIAKVIARLRTHPAIGVGLAHRICAEKQRNFLKGGSLFASAPAPANTAVLIAWPARSESKFGAVKPRRCWCAHYLVGCNDWLRMALPPSNGLFMITRNRG